MDGVFKKIGLFFICTLLWCCNNNHNKEHNRLLNEARLKEKELINEGRKLIQQNSNILIDSVFVFDIKSLNPKVKKEKPSIGLIDSIYYKGLRGVSNKNYVTFRLHKSDLVNFKSEYEFLLVQNQIQNANILYVTFTNFRIKDNKAEIRVKKNFGTSMREAAFSFEKIDNVWVFRKKTVFGDIG